MPELILYIDGYRVYPEQAELLRTMDSGCDGFNFTIPWEPGKDPSLDDVTKPFGYQEMECFIDGHLQLMGRVYNIETTTNEGGTIKNIECFSKTADIVDSTMIPPYEANNIGLLARCKQQCEQFGIGVIVDEDIQLFRKKTITTKRNMTKKEKENYLRKLLKSVPNDFPIHTSKENYESFNQKMDEIRRASSGQFKIVRGRKTIYEEIKFSRVAAKKTDKIFDHLKSLASQRGYLLSCTREGDLFITKANTDGKSTGTIEEGSAIASEYGAKFNGRNRFAKYRALAKSSRKSKTNQASVANDNVVSVPRYLTFNTPDNLPGEAQNAAEWMKNKVLADALTIPFPVNSIYGPDGNLWDPNTLVTVISKTIGCPDGFTFLIRNVRFIYNVSGITAKLDLVPPTVFTTGAIEEPWI